MEDNAVRFENVSKRFRIYHEKHHSLKENVLTMFRDRRRWEDFWALRGVDIEIPKGQMLGIIGENGSGKSTCLKLLARIYRPDTGAVTVNGSLTALIELGAGFQPDFTGRENVYLNGSILGFSRSEIDDRYDEIVAFAELEKFIDTPVKNYSSGMYMRLGFSIAIHVDPDILLIDEILAVGDEAFQQKCLERIRYFRKVGKTIVFVSHALGSVEALCDRAILLTKGKLTADGQPAHTIAEYRRRLGTETGAQIFVPELAPCQEKSKESFPDVDGLLAGVDEKMAGMKEVMAWLERRVSEPMSIENARERIVELEKTMSTVQGQGAVRDQALGDLARKLELLESRILTLLSDAPPLLPRSFGTNQIEFLDVDFLDENGTPGRKFRSGDSLTIRVKYRVNEAVEDPIFGISFCDQRGSVVFGTNTVIDRVARLDTGTMGTLEIKIPRLALLGGLFFVTLAVHSPDNTVQYHRMENYYKIQVEPRREYDGAIDMECNWRVIAGEVTSEQ